MSDQYTAPGRSLGAVFRGLNVHLLLFIALPLLVITGLGIRIGFTQLHDFQEALLKNDLDLVARAIQGPISEALEQGQPDSVKVALQSIFSIERVYGVSVFNRQGERIASGGIAEADLTQSAIPSLLAATGEKQEVYREIQGREVFSYFLPLFDRAGRANGFLQVTRRYEDFTQSLNTLTVAAWALWVVLGVTIVAALLLGHYGGVGRHVERLLAAMRRISSGDTDHRVAETGPQETRVIGKGLNQMLDAIQQSEAQLLARREEQEQLQHKLNEADKMAAIGRTARGFAHELGAPLSVIDGRARRLERRSDLPPGAEIDTAAIRKQVQHLTATVKQLLESSRAGHSRKILFPADQLLNMVRAVVDTDNYRCTLQVSTDHELPSIHGDPEQLALALLNVTRNALQAARERVLMRAFVEAQTLRIDIDDDGDGLPEIAPERLLEPFFTTKASGNGTGLGLAITNNIIRDHDGSLTLHNGQLGGCCASIALPLREGGQTR